jgi:hypothetical protein
MLKTLTHRGWLRQTPLRRCPIVQNEVVRPCNYKTERVRSAEWSSALALFLALI